MSRTLKVNPESGERVRVLIAIARVLPAAHAANRPIDDDVGVQLGSLWAQTIAARGNDLWRRSRRALAEYNDHVTRGTEPPVTASSCLARERPR
jgi:hypothetical protein